MTKLPDGIVVVLELPGGHRVLIRSRVLSAFLRRNGRSVRLCGQVVVVFLSDPELLYMKRKINQLQIMWIWLVTKLAN